MPSKVLPQTLARLTDEDQDPLAGVTAPPPNETPEERELRLAAEEHARKVSDTIDEELNRQRAAEKKFPKPVKVLLLGQSESGKSTTLKNFQLMNSPKAFRTEKASWRAVIQLNVVRSILLILNVMSETQSSPIPTSSPSPYSGTSPNLNSSHHEASLTPDHLKLKLRLAPLISLEETLRRCLAPGGSVELEATHMPNPQTSSYLERSRNITREVAVHSMSPWKTAFNKIKDGVRGSMESEEDIIDWNNPNDPGIILSACREDMMSLWGDPVVQKLLQRKGLRLEEMAGL
ncbi:hypothetical protein ONZ45_g17823 [Pleurotus djamor]|nr:hypothetical protein ONZ45_g17823 [Pleurotus djamor]